jgi:D-xylose 1-dehydrogenase (NADP+, D-xylono-1,5-lactone-forming)
MTLRWGLLSTARINDALLGGLAASDSGAVVAVASRDLARARTYAQSRGIPIAHGSYEAMLADPGVDAVYVSLPNGLHLEWTERALRAGKHVLCEKPMGHDPARVAAAFALAQERGLVLSEAFMYRHHPQTIRLAQLVAEGAIGRLRSIRSHFSFLLADSADVRLSADLEGGALMDLGCYCVSAARLLAGEPEAFAGVQVHGGDGVDASFAGALRFGDGVVAAFEASFRSAAGYGLEVTGETGTLRVADPWHIHAAGIELVTADGEPRQIEVAAADSYRLEVEDLARAVAGERPSRLGRDDAVGQARALQGLYAAAGAV